MDLKLNQPLYDKVLTESEVLTNVYNEQLDSLCRLRIDAKFYDQLCVANPDDKTLADKRKSNVENLKRKEMMLPIIKKEMEEAKMREQDAEKSKN